MRIPKNKRIVILTLIVLFLSAAVLQLLTQPAMADSLSLPPVSAEAAVVMDMDSGSVIFSRNADKRMRIASTTKIMTALVVLDRCALDDKVEIKREWTLAEGSSMYLKAGQVYTVEELLYGLMLASGNDAATSLACHTADSTAAFAELMNAKAAELGMSNSHFQNPHGLDQESHYSTAADMALLASHAMKNPVFAKIVSTKQAVIQGVSFINHNKLLWRCEGVIGVKTGYTEASGRTLVSCARRGDTSLVCVTLNDSDDWDDHTALYNWGFDSFITLKAGCQKYEVPVVSGVSGSVIVSCNEERSFLIENSGNAGIEVCLPKFCYAPVRRGDKAGELCIKSGNEVLGRIELVYDNNVPVDESVPLTFWERVKWYWYYANEHSIYNVYPMY